MDICIHPEFIERLSRINWFSRVFEPDTISTGIPHFYVNSWEEAKPLFRGIKWDWVTNEALNELSSHLAVKHLSLYTDTWNKAVNEAKPILRSLVDPKVEEVRTRHKLGETLCIASTGMS